MSQTDIMDAECIKIGFYGYECIEIHRSHLKEPSNDDKDQMRTRYKKKHVGNEDICRIEFTLAEFQL